MNFRFFSGKRNKSLQSKVACAEILTLPQLLANTRSFKSFCENNEVFDVCTQKVVKQKERLFQLYSHGNDIKKPVYIFNKN